MRHMAAVVEDDHRRIHAGHADTKRTRSNQP